VHPIDQPEHAVALDLFCIRKGTQLTISVQLRLHRILTSRSLGTLLPLPLCILTHRDIYEMV
jgi:hypothetical protein